MSVYVLNYKRKFIIIDAVKHNPTMIKPKHKYYKKKLLRVYFTVHKMSIH